jgi:hypothetical protein
MGDAGLRSGFVEVSVLNQALDEMALPACELIKFLFVLIGKALTRKDWPRKDDGLG